MPVTQTLDVEEAIKILLWAGVGEDATKYYSSDGYGLNVKLAGKGKDENEGNTYMSLEKWELEETWGPRKPRW